MSAGPDPRVLSTMENAPWLPPGGRAEVIRTRVVPTPMCLVRLLVRDGSRVFCVSRAHSGKLDLPTRQVQEQDPDGHTTILGLVRDIVGPSIAPRFVGAVRNTVGDTAVFINQTTTTLRPSVEKYEWPIPVAHFGVWTVDAPPKIAGTWLPASDHELRQRHWYPLLADS